MLQFLCCLLQSSLPRQSLILFCYPLLPPWRLRRLLPRMLLQLLPTCLLVLPHSRGQRSWPVTPRILHFNLLLLRRLLRPWSRLVWPTVHAGPDTNISSRITTCSAAPLLSTVPRNTFSSFHVTTSAPCSITSCRCWWTHMDTNSSNSTHAFRRIRISILQPERVVPPEDGSRETLTPTPVYGLSIRYIHTVHNT